MIINRHTEENINLPLHQLKNQRNKQIGHFGKLWILEFRKCAIINFFRAKDKKGDQHKSNGDWGSSKAPTVFIAGHRQAKQLRQRFRQTVQNFSPDLQSAAYDEGWCGSIKGLAGSMGKLWNSQTWEAQAAAHSLQSSGDGESGQLTVVQMISHGSSLVTIFVLHAQEQKVHWENQFWPIIVLGLETFDKRSN